MLIYTFTRTSKKYQKKCRYLAQKLQGYKQWCGGTQIFACSAPVVCSGLQIVSLCSRGSKKTCSSSLALRSAPLDVERHKFSLYSPPGFKIQSLRSSALFRASQFCRSVPVFPSRPQDFVVPHQCFALGSKILLLRSILRSGQSKMTCSMLRSVPLGCKYIPPNR